jgi:hypothetical protein
MTDRQIEHTCNNALTGADEPAVSKATKPKRSKKSTIPRNFRKTAQQEIGKKYTKIVRTLAKQAAEGSVQHTRLLFDLGGVKEEVRASSNGRRRKAPSLGAILLKEVKELKRRKELEAQGGEAK